jgi:hypothetical protein
LSSANAPVVLQAPIASAAQGLANIQLPALPADARPLDFLAGNVSGDLSSDRNGTARSRAVPEYGAVITPHTGLDVQPNEGNGRSTSRYGDDVLLAGAGSDMFVGDDGRDILVGGFGADRGLDHSGDGTRPDGPTAQQSAPDARGEALKSWSATADSGRAVDAGGTGQTVFDNLGIDYIGDQTDLQWFQSDAGKGVIDGAAAPATRERTSDLGSNSLADKARQALYWMAFIAGFGSLVAPETKKDRKRDPRKR